MRSMHRDAFTLAEMLVVLVIILLLATLVMSAGRGAMEVARKTGCVSNLRQMGVMLTMYQDDNDSLYPIGAYSDDAEQGSRWEVSWHDELSGYSHSGPGLFYCPDVDRRQHYRYSYGANFWLFGYGATPLGSANVELNSVVLAEKANIDWCFLPYDYPLPAPTGPGRIDRSYLVDRHGGRGAVLMADGSVRMVASEKIRLVRVER